MTDSNRCVHCGTVFMPGWLRCENCVAKEKAEKQVVDDGGPAFPRNLEGMSLRQFYAGIALMGLLNNAESRILSLMEEDKSNGQILAENCFHMADAMIKEGKKETT